MASEVTEKKRRSSPGRRLSPARKDTLPRRFEAIVGRGEILEALEATGDRRADVLLSMMLDPAYSSHSFAKLCEKTGLRYQDVLDMLRRAKLDEGLLRMFKHVPDVLEDTARDARSRTKTCWKCDGRGSHRKRDCPECDGTGKIRVVGHVESRKMVLEATGIARR